MSAARGRVVVVGGGVVGAACAYYLARDGWSVEVVDRGAFGAACSHGNCGYVCPSHVLPLATPGAVWSTLKTLVRRNSPLKVRPATALANLGWFLGFARRRARRGRCTAGRSRGPSRGSPAPTPAGPSAASCGGRAS